MTDTPHQSRIDLVWAAGVFDIKGRINLEARSDTRNKAPTIYILGNDKSDAILYKFKSLFGGGVFRTNPRTTALYWKARTNLALQALKDMLPFFNDPATAQLARFMLLNHHKVNRSGRYSPEEKIARKQYESNFRDLRTSLYKQKGIPAQRPMHTPFIDESFPVNDCLALTRASMKAPYED